MLFMTCLTDSPQTRAMIAHQEYFGRFMSPFCNGNRTDIAKWDNWALDNGAFSGFDQGRFYHYLETLLPYKSACKFVIAPDVPFHWEATLKKFLDWQPLIKSLGFPIALAVQNGATPDAIPWQLLDALFIGGDTAWKRGHWRSEQHDLFTPQIAYQESEALTLVKEAKQRGLWVHFGRQANSKRQLINAFQWGADSVDGTRETKAPNKEFRWLSQTIWELHNQHLLKQRWQRPIAS